MKKCSVIVLLMIVLFSVSACSQSNNASSFLKGSTKLWLYEDVLYMIDGTTLMGTSISEDTLQKVPVCADSLCSHDTKSCPLFLGSGAFSMILDPVESKKNHNMPILYIAYQDMYWDYEQNQVVDNGYAIKRYDMRTNTSYDIVSGYEDNILELYKNGDTIYYRTYSYEDGYHLESIRKNGSDHKKLNCENEAFTIQNIVGEAVYYTDSIGNLYKTDVDFSTNEYLMDTKTDMGMTVISDTHIYYPDDIEVYDTIEGKDFRKCSIYRIPLDNLEEAPECILEDVFYQGSPICKINEQEILFSKLDAFYRGKAWKFDYNGERQELDIFSNNNGIKYKWNMDTMDEDIAIHIPGYEILSYYTSDEEYIIVAATPIEEIDTETGYKYELQTILYDRKRKGIGLLIEGMPYKNGKEFIHAITA